MLKLLGADSTWHTINFSAVSKYYALLLHVRSQVKYKVAADTALFYVQGTHVDLT